MRSHEQLGSVVQDEKRSTTALLEFFRLNASIPGGTGYRYTEIIAHYRTIDGVLYPTFQEAAIKLGLFQQDSFYTSLSEDFAYQNPNQQEKVMRLTVRDIEKNLEATEKSLEDFGLGHLIEEDSNEIRITKYIEDALEAPIPPECIDCREKLNEAQENAFNSIMAYVNEEKPGCFFVDGPGGTGKTFLYNALYAEVRLAEVSLACDFPKQGSLAAQIKAAALIIWDEASMTRKENIESLVLLLRDLCHLDQPFGGKVIVFGEDFRQFLPILPRRSQREAVGVSVVSSYIWPLLVKFRLTENIRAKEDLVYSAFLLALGNGQLQSDESANVQLPEHIVQNIVANEDSVSVLTAMIFPEISNPTFDSGIFNERAILTPMNEEVDSINDYLIK
ncbi:uncharacterized protein LOC110731803 [Chenopodium quinoa]|uniref:uncharacterized protein LOC110731803 n=1 Tax=Chenopodium quinoa TaxID=63459 RepID=UPI000B76C1C3|nr:uncharacterized protein LOC110731803 [Chenopodium quinoa]